MDFVLDTAFVLAAVAFFKSRFNLLGWKAVGAAFVSVLFIQFVPELSAALPQYADAIQKVLDTIRLFVTAAGGYDLTLDLQEKNALVKAYVHDAFISEDVSVG